MSEKMYSLGYQDNHSDAVLTENKIPNVQGHDLLVKIDAIAVNPVDVKVKSAISEHLTEPKVVGWDAAGTVLAVGESCEYFKIGDKVFYAGDVTRSGCYASHQLVDERIVGSAPSNCSATEAAAMPLTSLTAWECLFSRMKIDPQREQGKNLLIIGGAGGVGSIAIQLAKQVAELNVIASASRTESADWCRQLGADYIVNHRKDLVIEYRNLGIADPDYILCLNDTDAYFDTMAELIAPQGMLCVVVTNRQKLNLDSLKNKSAGIVWEFMFTRPMYHTTDMSMQHEILTRIAEMLEQGQLQCTLQEVVGPMTATNLNLAHQKLLSGSTIGKIALSAIPG